MTVKWKRSVNNTEWSVEIPLASDSQKQKEAPEHFPLLKALQLSWDGIKYSGMSWKYDEAIVY